MSTENTTTPDVTVTDNLDEFSASFFGETKETSEAPAKAEEEVEVEQEVNDAPAEEVDTQSEETGDDDTPAPAG